MSASNPSNNMTDSFSKAYLQQLRAAKAEERRLERLAQEERFKTEHVNAAVQLIQGRILYLAEHTCLTELTVCGINSSLGAILDLDLRDVQEATDRMEERFKYSITVEEKSDTMDGKYMAHLFQKDIAAALRLVFPDSVVTSSAKKGKGSIVINWE